MATPTKYYPPLSDLVTFEKLPSEFGFIKDSLEDVFDEFFYDNIYESKSESGNTAFYSLDIISPRKVAIEIPSSGISLVLNPNSADSDISSFPITINWQWEILAYLRDFNTDTFSYSIEDFFRLGAKIIGVSEETALELALRAFVEPQGANYTRIQQFVSDLNALYGTTVPVPTDSEDTYTALIETIEEAGIESSYMAIFALYLTNSDIAIAKERINYFFSSFIPSDIESYIIDLITPKARATLSLSLGLEFSDNILKPVTPEGAYIQGGKSTFVFPVADIQVDTQTGINLDTEFSGSLQPPYASIANTGLIVQIESLKLDLSKSTNIPEADTDGRPVEFVGVYARALSVTLPSKWFHEVQGQTSSTLRIGAYNLLVGTGGFSGTILLETVPAANGGQITDYYSGDFDLNFPITAFEKNTSTNQIEEVALQNDTDLLSLLNTNLDAGFTTTFKFPLSLTTQSGELETFENIGDYQKYLSSLSNDNILWKTLGQNGFKIGFSKFDIVFQQNSIISSNIEGRLVIPNFKDTTGNNAEITVVGHLFEDGDFNLTASVEAGIPICLGDNGSVFKILLKSLSLGKNDDNYYIEVSGDLDFSNNTLLKDMIAMSIEIKKLRIYSDGSFEIEGGSIPIPVSVHLNLGPVEVDVTNITLGAEKLDSGDYKFIGFDCGVSTGAGGMDLRGDGIKIYFKPDGSEMFLRIAGIGIDLIIPGTASEETAALILKGYLSIKENEYVGAVSFKLPKAKIAGGAAMKLSPKIPAFAVDAFLELPAPIPLGTTGLGIFGFRGLFGLRYIADLPEGATSDPNKMFEFYTDKKPNPLNSGTPEKGLHLGKIVKPEDRTDGFKNTGTPISIGAGVSIGTAADAGRVFSMQAFLFLSLPEFFMISGKGNVLSERVSIVSETEPPFFAYMVFTNEFISVGMGADYKVTAEEGEFLDFHAEGQMAYFFRDASAWYIHFGTKEEPNTAKVLKKIFNLNAYAYLMLSVAGIQAGAGVRFELKKKYGPVSVELSAYGDAYTMISFRKPQVGGGIACGGAIGASVFGVGFSFVLDAYLTVTVPKPFIVNGGVSIKLVVNLWIKKWRKTINIPLNWRFDDQLDISEIGILPLIDQDWNNNKESQFPSSAYHIGSKSSYKLSYFEYSKPGLADRDNIETIPLDSYIDIQFKKPVNPENVHNKVGGLTNAPVRHYELIPPIDYKVRHDFIIEDINIQVYKTSNNSWVNYNPYEALIDSAFLPGIDKTKLKLGYWQKKGSDYNNLRILADTPFSFADSMTEGFIPEQIGVTSGTLFCPEKKIENHCISWDKEKIYSFGRWHSFKSLTFSVSKTDASIKAFSNIFKIPLSLGFNNHSKIEIILPEKSSVVNLKLFSFSESVTVFYFDYVEVSNFPLEFDYSEVHREVLTFKDYFLPLKFESEENPIKKIVIEPFIPNEKDILNIKMEIFRLESELLEGRDINPEEIKGLEKKLESILNRSCDRNNYDKELSRVNQLIRETEEVIGEINNELTKIKLEKDKVCTLTKNLINVLKKIEEDEAIEFSSLEKIISKSFIKSNSLRTLSENNNNEKELLNIERKLKAQYSKEKDKCTGLTRLYNEKIKEVKDKADLLEFLKSFSELVPKNEFDLCRSYIHEVCYLTQTEYLNNTVIPSKEMIEADYSALENARKVISPIWRPDEFYTIEVITNEKINNNHNRRTHYFSFKTSGPLGHFDQKDLTKEVKEKYDLNENTGEPNKKSTKFSDKLEIPENSLKYYLDYDKSFPNPSGNIINQKPLFFKNAEILIFFTEPYVYHFFNNWPDYNGLGQRYSSLVIEIVDPSENASPSAGIPPVLTIKPMAETKWQTDSKPLIKSSISVINNLRNPKLNNPAFAGQTCWQVGGDPLVPASKGAVSKVKNLKPLKLYTVNVFNKYSKNRINPVSKQIHSYTFQTSRYANFDEQVHSYQLKSIDSSTNEVIEYNAIYNLDYKLNELGITVNQIRDVINKTDSTSGFNSNLIKNYPHSFQRLIEGYLKQEPLNPALNTEINLLRNQEGKIFGIWVRNPEPFNDPRTPEVELQKTVKMVVNGTTDLSASIIFSNDNCEFIISSDRLINEAISGLKLTFTYLVWSGVTYIQEHSTTTDNLI